MNFCKFYKLTGVHVVELYTVAETWHLCGAIKAQVHNAQLRPCCKKRTGTSEESNSSLRNDGSASKLEQCDGLLHLVRVNEKVVDVRKVCPDAVSLSETRLKEQVEEYEKFPL